MDAHSNNLNNPNNSYHTAPSQVIASLAQANPGVFSNGMSAPPPVPQAFQDTTNTVSAAGRTHIEIQERMNELTLGSSENKRRKIEPHKNGASSSNEKADFEVVIRPKQEPRNLVDGDDPETPAPQKPSKPVRRSRPKQPPLSPLHLAALKNDDKKLISEIDKDASSVALLDRVGNTPLHIAAGAGAVDCMKVLIDKKANINLQNQNGLTPLHLAIRHNQPGCFDMLTRNGAQIDAPNNDKITPFHLAAKYGRQGFLEELITLSIIQEKDNLLNVEDSWGQTPLHYAVIQQKLECAEVLIKKGAAIEKIDNTKMTSLLSAIVSGSSDCAAFLISKGGVLTKKNNSNKNAIHLAADSGDYETTVVVLDRLIEKIGKEEVRKLINEKDLAGITPLAYAKEQEIRKLLIGSGAQEEKEINLVDVTCAICREILHKSVNLVCGHTFCGACIQAWRKMNDTCPTCRTEVRFVGGYMQNWKMSNLLAENFKDLIQQREDEKQGDPLEATIENVALLGKALGTEIVLDKNHTTILAIDNEFPMHLTYMPMKKKLCVYSPILARLPEVRQRLTNIFKTLMLYGENGFGDGMSGVGVIVAKQLVVLHVEIPMEFAPSDSLRTKVILFVQLVKQWRDAMKALSDGKQIDNELKERLISVKFSFMPPSSALEDVQENLKQLPEEYQVIKDNADWTIVAIGDESIPPIRMQYLVDTDVIRLSCSLRNNVPDHLPLYQDLLSNSVFGFKTGGARFQLTEEGELILILDVQLTRAGMKSFSKTTLKDFLPIFVENIKEWRKKVASHVAPPEKNAVVDDHAMVMD